jgi:hypothetical protein
VISAPRSPQSTPGQAPAPRVTCAANLFRQRETFYCRMRFSELRLEETAVRTMQSVCHREPKGFGMLPKNPLCHRLLKPHFAEFDGRFELGLSRPATAHQRKDDDGDNFYTAGTVRRPFRSQPGAWPLEGMRWSQVMSPTYHFALQTSDGGHLIMLALHFSRCDRQSKSERPRATPKKSP